jgi:DNA-directed RNA polymerase alpha subunit
VPKLVKALSTPVSDLLLTARPASALKTLNIQYVYELVQKSPLDLFRLPNFGEKSLREVKTKLATLGLTLGMTLEDDAYRAAAVAAVAANIAAAKGCAAFVPDRRGSR